jgi:hypothetical protein
VLHDWITHPESRARLFGVTSTAYRAMAPKDQDAARKVAKQRLEDRFKTIIQRRHDCIHNCDRPWVRLQPLRAGEVVLKVIQDVEFLVRRCDEHINIEYRRFLSDAGCLMATISAAGY